ncbi:MAG: hypothetical protein Q7J84_02800 [Sulfuricaulis sp.]|nr:hypothetical protein [Sulfuricaulis sp.]
MHPAPAVADSAITKSNRERQCGTCTACCDGWLRINIHGQDIYPGNPCQYSTGHNCMIYENRPDACRKFICGWFEENSALPEKFRPDKISVIFVIATWRSLPIYILTPAGRDPDGEVLGWMKNFSLETHRPFLYQSEGEWYAFGPPEFQQEILKKVAKGEKLW